MSGSFEDALFTYPCDLAIDSDGNIYVAGNGVWDGGENLD
ncbi:SBBP repeat-containing protein [uncultured Bacteroides sp.]|nr:SBBP repeat-containing protein [uncultured Bacteroides sp.]